jgi:hypothetical protein
MTITADFLASATFGLVLRTLTNSQDKTTWTFVDGPLFRLTVKEIGTATTLTLEPGPASDEPPVLDLPLVNETRTTPKFGPDDGLGERAEIRKEFRFDNLGASTADLTVHFIADVLSSHPDRIRFSLAMAWAGAATHAVVWAVPTLLPITPVPQDHYFIAAGGGMVTRAPQTDLVGDGVYQFTSESRFEPELNTTATNQLEALYPGVLSAEVSAYGSRATGAAIMVHGEGLFRAARIRDFYNGTLIHLEHEILGADPVTTQNGGIIAATDLDHFVVANYVTVFTTLGEVFGEEVGIRLRRWYAGAQETLNNLTGKPGDRTDMDTVDGIPFWLQFNEDDAENETSLTATILFEYRELFGTAKLLTRHAYKYSLFAEQDASATHPSVVLDGQPDLFDYAVDAAKETHSDTLLAPTLVTAPLRAPSPNDGRAFFRTKTFGAARTKYLSEQEGAPAYPAIDTVILLVTSITAVGGGSVFDGTFTTIPLLDDWPDAQWDVFSDYAKAGHASHTKHLGWATIEAIGGDIHHLIERANETDFKTNKRISIIGDITGLVATSDVVTVYWNAEGYLPSSLAPTTTLCCGADDHGSGVAVPANGWGFQSLADYTGNIDDRGIVFRDPLSRPICFASQHLSDGQTYNHTPGDPVNQTGLRLILAAFRTAGAVAVMNDDGPCDVLVGVTDGFTTTTRVNRLTNQPKSWGASPFFITAFGDLMRMGSYRNNGTGHIATNAGEAAYSLLEATGTTEFVRESIAFDWFHGRKLVTVNHQAVTGSKMGDKTTPAGNDSFTPLYHTTFGLSNSLSIAALITRFSQVQIAFTESNFYGRRLRSLKEQDAATITSLLDQTVSPGSHEGHDVYSTESGVKMPAIFHTVFAHRTDPRRVIAVLAHPFNGNAGQVFDFDPALYESDVPGYLGAYDVTRYVFGPENWTTQALGTFRGVFQITEKLGPSEVVAYEMNFTSTFRFVYKYDDDALKDIPISTQQDRIRLEDIHGSGERFQCGFLSDGIDNDEAAISAMAFQAQPRGKSETK